MWAEALLCGSAWWGEGGRVLICEIFERTDGFFFIFKPSKTFCSFKLICKHYTSLKWKRRVGRQHQRKLWLAKGLGCRRAGPGSKASHSRTAEGCVGLRRARTDSQETYSAAAKTQALSRNKSPGHCRIRQSQEGPVWPPHLPSSEHQRSCHHFCSIPVTHSTTGTFGRATHLPPKQA